MLDALTGTPLVTTKNKMVPTIVLWRGVWSDFVVPTVVPTNEKALDVSCFLWNLTVCCCTLIQ